MTSYIQSSHPPYTLIFSQKDNGQLGVSIDMMLASADRLGVDGCATPRPSGIRRSTLTVEELATVTTAATGGDWAGLCEMVGEGYALIPHRREDRQRMIGQLADVYSKLLLEKNPELLDSLPGDDAPEYIVLGGYLVHRETAVELARLRCADEAWDACPDELRLVTIASITDLTRPSPMVDRNGVAYSIKHYNQLCLWGEGVHLFLDGDRKTVMQSVQDMPMGSEMTLGSLEITRVTSGYLGTLHDKAYRVLFQ